MEILLETAPSFNIANVAYGYAKILRAAGREADVLCYDLLNILSLPEWMDGEFEVPIRDQWNPPLDDPRIKAATVTCLCGSGAFGPGTSGFPTVRRALLGCGWVDDAFGHRNDMALAGRSVRDVLAYRPLVEHCKTRFFANFDIVFDYAMAAVPPLLASACRMSPWRSEPFGIPSTSTVRSGVSLRWPIGRRRIPLLRMQLPEGSRTLELPIIRMCPYRWTRTFTVPPRRGTGDHQAFSL